MKVATLALIKQDGKVLLGEKKKGEIGTGILSGPGGKLDAGETLIECVIRETFEEYGIQLLKEDIRQIARITFYASGEPDFDVHIYHAGRFEGVLMETPDVKTPEWFPLETLPLSRMYDGDRHWFEKALGSEPFCANVYYKERAKEFERIKFLPPDF
jgi:8-oxo-dGTP diphosphatase